MRAERDKAMDERDALLPGKQDIDPRLELVNEEYPFREPSSVTLPMGGFFAWKNPGGHYAFLRLKVLEPLDSPRLEIECETPFQEASCETADRARTDPEFFLQSRCLFNLCDKKFTPGEIIYVTLRSGAGPSPRLRRVRIS
jgi:hypothetical protein